jgi:N-acetylglucosamine kinase-like BadF-type ATPase
MTLGLGIDAGGSATRWALLDAAGGVVARGSLEAVNGHLFVPESRARFVAFAQALAAALPALPAAVVAGITGLTGDAPEAAVAAEILAAALGGAAVAVQDDLWIGYHAAFRPGEGIAVYAGTGSVGMHIRADGTIVRVGGRGILIDDAGSAFWIGKRGLDLLYRRIDAGEAAGALGARLYAAIGDDSWNAVRAHVYGGGRTAVAMLALAVAAAAAEDPGALAILAEAGRELARLAVVLAAREGRMQVAVLGRAATLHPVILTSLRAAVPGLEIAMPETDAAIAAAVVACSMAKRGAG